MIARQVVRRLSSRFSPRSGASVAAATPALRAPFMPVVVDFSSLSEPSYLSRPYKDIPASIGEKGTAQTAWEKSCYFKIDFKIPEEAMMYEAVQRFAAYNIGALAVTDQEGKVIGVISERDYVCKSTTVGEVCTRGSNIVVAKTTDSIATCMKKMLAKDIRHLPVVDDEKKEVVGMLSIKDLIKELQKEKDDIIEKLTDFNLGKGAFFQHG
ncbi:hypothetical protein NSK_001810 [Nannochloropsis salina CCMP1776]|uniref:CBS domain-containing protein n=1 Tax=Nannochloropsis salina CCMP1776 TaxID=1027361 RepID=A0A4D9D580_9STRA|nr:hypothetical protein NSK_001810 [Nannochloropsis salina CCMP1776]|eukprot:TFJ86722.1 hypothetical protein NSK_001810 [Nannochloropsis salina CCMP1776]